MMKHTFLLLTLSGVLMISSCQLFNKASKSSSNKCISLTQTDATAFNELSSDLYELVQVEQKDKNLIIQIKSNLNINSSNLYWNGSMRKGNPLKTSIKIVVKGEPSETSQTSQLCFDVSEMESFGENIKVYFMDDEETFDINFTQ